MLFPPISLGEDGTLIKEPFESNPASMIDQPRRGPPAISEKPVLPASLPPVTKKWPKEIGLNTFDNSSLNLPLHNLSLGWDYACIVRYVPSHRPRELLGEEHMLSTKKICCS